jgi:hypothetical protein
LNKRSKEKGEKGEKGREGERRRRGVKWLSCHEKVCGLSYIVDGMRDREREWEREREKDGESTLPRP